MFAKRHRFRARKSLGYLNPPIVFLLSFFLSVRAFLRGDPRLLIHNPHFLNPPVYLGACLAVLIAFLKSAWPEDPIAAFEVPRYLASIKPFLNLLPLPVISIAILYGMLINIPMYIVSRLLRKNVRISRIIAATSYSFGTSLLLIAIYFVLRPMTLEILVGADLNDQKIPRMIWTWTNGAIMIFCFVRSSKLMGIAHGMTGFQFAFLNTLIIGFPAVVLEFALEPTSKYRVILAIIEPRPVSAYYLPSNSMSPSLPIGTELLVNRLFPHSEIRAGDVVVFRLPRDPTQTYIKRVIGVGGDEIQFIDGLLHINGDPVIRTMIDAPTPALRQRYQPIESRFTETLPNGTSYEIIEIENRIRRIYNQTYSVPDNHFFALGDNRDRSTDSRYDVVGFVPVRNIVGKVYFVIFPMDRGPIGPRPN